MTPDQKQLAIWGGGTLALIVVGAAALAARGGTLDAQMAKAGKLHKDYTELYHPDHPKDGIPAPEAERDLMRAKDLQSEELDKAEATLVVELHGSYADGDQVSAGHQVTADHYAIKQTAQMKHVALPPSLTTTPASTRAMPSARCSSATSTSTARCSTSASASA